MLELVVGLSRIFTSLLKTIYSFILLSENKKSMLNIKKNKTTIIWLFKKSGGTGRI
jgi:hypothetical protein